MRRLISFAMLTLVSTVLLTVFALPGLAADGAEAPEELTEEVMDDDHAEDKDHAEDEGMWTGLIASLAAGVLVGAIGFFSAGTEGLDGHGDDH